MLKARAVTAADKNLHKRKKDFLNHWVSGLRPLSGILNTRENNVLETGSVFSLR
jgi:hypothetical protein